MVLWIAGALSDIIESSFSKVYPKHDCFCQFYITTSSVIFSKVQSKLGVSIIHGHTLYTGKHITHVHSTQN